MRCPSSEDNHPEVFLPSMSQTVCIGRALEATEAIQEAFGMRVHGLKMGAQMTEHKVVGTEQQGPHALSLSGTMSLDH